MKISRQTFPYLLVFLSSLLALVACGDDSGTGGKSDVGNVSLQVESSDDLPNCSKNRNGDIAEVLGERKAYVCDNGRWEVSHDILDSVKTEDDLSACLSKNEGDSVWVTDESAIFVCIDRKWENAKKNPLRTSSPSRHTNLRINCRTAPRTATAIWLLSIPRSVCALTASGIT